MFICKQMQTIAVRMICFEDGEFGCIREGYGATGSVVLCGIIC